MSGIPRVRYKYETSPEMGPSPNTGYRRVTLGKYSMRLSNGQVVRGFAPDPFVDIPITQNSGKVCRDAVHPGPPYQEGSNLLIKSVEFPAKRVQASGHYVSDIDVTFFGYGTGKLIYDGGFYPEGLLSDWNVPAILSDSNSMPDLGAYEMRAYQRTKPRIEKASAYIFAAEFKDTPRMLRTTARTFHDVWNGLRGNGISRQMQPKTIADNFLNHQFGWLPFIGDLKKFSSTFQRNHEIKGRLTAQNDKWVVRRAFLDKEEYDRNISRGGGMGVIPSGDLISKLFKPNAGPTWELNAKYSKQVNAVGQYKYYRPEFDENLPDYNSAWTRIQRDLAIYGARVSPANIYRATPWTWLIDWATDFGSVIDKFDDVAIDAIAARYLYIMQHETYEQTVIQTLPFISGTVQASWVQKSETKVRYGASTPYGFGLSWNQLSPRQLAILAALKISRP